MNNIFYIQIIKSFIILIILDYFIYAKLINFDNN